jgi:hypothetical protein
MRKQKQNEAKLKRKVSEKRKSGRKREWNDTGFDWEISVQIQDWPDIRPIQFLCLAQILLKWNVKSKLRLDIRYPLLRLVGYLAKSVPGVSLTICFVKHCKTLLHDLTRQLSKQSNNF